MKTVRFSPRTADRHSTVFLQAVKKRTAFSNLSWLPRSCRCIQEPFSLLTIFRFHQYGMSQARDEHITAYQELSNRMTMVPSNFHRKNDHLNSVRNNPAVHATFLTVKYQIVNQSASKTIITSPCNARRLYV
jgi:hypothetical protein